MTFLGTFEDSATRTSPFRNTWIQRGCFRPAANALTLSPGAATGVSPSAQLWAVGIVSVRILPCRLASGIVGAAPHAGSGEPCVNCRDTRAAPPTSATTREKTAEKLNSLFPWSNAVEPPKVHQNLRFMMLPVMSWDNPPHCRFLPGVDFTTVRIQLGANALNGRPAEHEAKRWPLRLHSSDVTDRGRITCGDSNTLLPVVCRAAD
jgi:hypothetical protein